jgi:putative transposase
MAQARDIFVCELRKVRDETEFPLIGYVVVPEHVHLLTGEPKQRTPSSVLQKLKLRVSWKMHKGKLARNSCNRLFEKPVG